MAAISASIRWSRASGPFPAAPNVRGWPGRPVTAWRSTCAGKTDKRTPTLFGRENSCSASFTFAARQLSKRWMDSKWGIIASELRSISMLAEAWQPLHTWPILFMSWTASRRATNTCNESCGGAGNTVYRMRIYAGLKNSRTRDQSRRRGKDRDWWHRTTVSEGLGRNRSAHGLQPMRPPVIILRVSTNSFP